MFHSTVSLGLVPPLCLGVSRCGELCYHHVLCFDLVMNDFQRRGYNVTSHPLISKTSVQKSRPETLQYSNPFEKLYEPKPEPNPDDDQLQVVFLSLSRSFVNKANKQCSEVV